MSVGGNIKNSTMLIIFIVIFQSDYAVWAGVQTIAIGSDYGIVNRVWPLKIVKEIGLSTDNYHGTRCISDVKINGVSQGLKGDTDFGPITLGRNEYISKIVYRTKIKSRNKSCITLLKFYTNSGRSFGYGNDALCNYYDDSDEDSNYLTIQNVRVLAIGGETSSLGLEKLNIKYIDKYQPSITEATHVTFIVAYSPPFSEFEEYTNRNYKTLESYEKATEHMMTQSNTFSVGFEFLLQISYSYSFDTANTTIENMRNEFEKELQSGIKRKQTIPGGYVGIKLFMGELMKGPNNIYWMYPTTGTFYSVIEITEISGLLGCYDLTGVLYTQMQNLKRYKTIRNGYVYYAENQSML